MKTRERLIRDTFKRGKYQDVKHVERVMRGLDALTAKVHDAIDRLKELRTALISAAVTGKIDVRAATATASAAQDETR